MAMAVSIALARLPSSTSPRVSLPLESVGGGASKLLALEGCKKIYLQFNPLRSRIEGRGKARVRGSVNGGGGGAAEESGCDAAAWLRERLPSQLESNGVEVDASRRIAEACADACARFLATGRPFDPMMIMDAMEEEIERRDLRGDEFLPFELGRKAAKVLTERWNALPVAERPKTFHQEPYVNKKDVVDFDKWPENLKLP